MIVLESAVNRELRNLTRSPNLHVIRSLTELDSVLCKINNRCDASSAPVPVRRWSDAAEEYGAAFRRLIARDLDINKVRRRWEILRTLESTTEA